MMEACFTVEREVEKIVSKLTSIQDYIQSTVQKEIDDIEELQRSIVLPSKESGSPLSLDQVDIIKQKLSMLKKVVSKVAVEHRDLHGTVSKVGKAIDKNFISDFATTNAELLFMDSEKQNLLNQAIIQHFYRQGMHSVADELIKETNMTEMIETKKPFLELNRILDALKQRDLGPAMEWVQKHHEHLQRKVLNAGLSSNMLQLLLALHFGVPPS